MIPQDFPSSPSQVGGNIAVAWGVLMAVVGEVGRLTSFLVGLSFRVHHSRPSWINGCCLKQRVLSPRNQVTLSTSVLFRTLTFGASYASDCGSISSSTVHSMEKKIKEQLGADNVIVRDAYGDGRHVSINVIASVFKGESLVNRQRLVYRAIWEELEKNIHAVDQMITLTPEEAALNLEKKQNFDSSTMAEN